MKKKNTKIRYKIASPRIFDWIDWIQEIHENQ